MSKKILQALFLFTLLIAGQQAFAVKDYIVERAYFEDPTAQMSFEEAKQQIYQPMGQMLAKGYSPSVFWVRVKLEGSLNRAKLSHKESEKLIFRIQPSYLDEIRIFDPFTLNNTLRVTGDHYSAKGDEYSSLNFNFVVPQSADDRYIWLRVNTTSTYLMQVQALTREDCIHLDRIQEFGFAFYLAILFLLFLFPVLIWVSSRDFLVGVFTLKQFGAITLLIFNAGYLRLLFKNVDLDLLQFFVDLNLLAYTLVTMFFHYVFLKEYPMKSWAKAIFMLAMFAFPVELLLLILGFDRSALHLNMATLNLVVLSFLIIPAFGIDWGKAKQVIFSKRWLIFIHLLIFITAVSTTLPALGYFQGTQFSAFSGLAYGGITGVIFLLVLQYRYRIDREKTIARVSHAEAYAQSERGRREQQGQFLAMLTHELKTPLSIMKMGYSSPHQSEKVKKHIQTAIDDMTNVIDRCVIDDKLQNQEFQLSMTDCALNQLMIDKVALYDQSCRLSLDADKSYTVKADLQLLRICISNLIDNAIKYGDEHSPIDIQLTDSFKSGYVAISVKNTVGSAGIPDAEKIFEKYYRAPKAYEKTGSGLGLYLVKNFVELMSGYIECHHEGQEIIFTIYLPK
jgi:two-component system, sensor histidine kinase LadS